MKELSKPNQHPQGDGENILRSTELGKKNTNKNNVKNSVIQFPSCRSLVFFSLLKRGFFIWLEFAK